MKLSIIGGGGRVGANAAYAILLGGLVKEIVIVDASEEAAKGEALDLMHGTSLTAPMKIYTGGYNEVSGSDIIIITAGQRRKPEESRLDLINKNVSVFCGILEGIRQARLNDNTIILIVSNPVDILTYLAVQAEIAPTNKVMGIGTIVDSTRFRSFIAEHLNVSATQTNAIILGEHGDSMVPIFSTANVNGIPLQSIPGYDEAELQRLFERTKGSGAEIISLKGGASHVVGVAIREVVHSILLDKKSVLPLSIDPGGMYGMTDICISLPVIIGKSGVEKIIDMKMTDQELNGLKKSGEALKNVMTQVMPHASRVCY